MCKFRKYISLPQVWVNELHRDKYTPIALFESIEYICKMYERKIPISLNCGLDLIGEVLYGKWKIRLLCFINQGHKRPSELQRKIPDASRRVLNTQLKELEEHGIIEKTIYPIVPPKVEYNITEFGKTLLPVIKTMGQWGDKNKEQLQSAITKRLSN